MLQRHVLRERRCSPVAPARAGLRRCCGGADLWASGLCVARGRAHGCRHTSLCRLCSACRCRSKGRCVVEDDQRGAQRWTRQADGGLLGYEEDQAEQEQRRARQERRFRARSHRDRVACVWRGMVTCGGGNTEGLIDSACSTIRIRNTSEERERHNPTPER